MCRRNSCRVQHRHCEERNDENEEGHPLDMSNDDGNEIACKEQIDERMLDEEDNVSEELNAENEDHHRSQQADA